MWQQPDEGDYISRSAIEPHAQDISVEDIDILINVARDSLEWLASNQATSAALWCDLIINSDIPLLRRLAVHTLSVRSDLTADAKIDWLLTHIGLHDLEAHHETFQAVKQTYPQASPAQREKLIEAVLAYRWLGEDLSNREENTAYSTSIGCLGFTTQIPLVPWLRLNWTRYGRGIQNSKNQNIQTSYLG